MKGRRSRVGGEVRFEAERGRFVRLRKEVAEVMRSASCTNAYVCVQLYPFGPCFADIDEMLSGPRQEDIMHAKFTIVVKLGFGQKPLEHEMFEVGPEKRPSTYDGIADFLAEVNGRLEELLRDICVLEPICRAVRDEKFMVEEVKRTFGNV